MSDLTMGDPVGDPGAGGGEPHLIMYCRSWCPDCKQAREWLQARDVAYVEVDVELDPDARDAAAALNEGHLHTPTFLLGAECCVDFRPERLSELLDMM